MLPWAEIMKNPDKYFDDDDTPDGITIKDPSKMRIDKLRAIRTFWRNRQEAGRLAFKFKNVLPKHQREEPMSLSKGKAKAKAMKIEDDLGDIYNDLEAVPDDIADALSRKANSGKVGESSR
jgi:hypothetical protein